MGIPKFFRWISERYPLCSQLIQESLIPEFDCLYLDMNGIIHNCTHGNSDDVHFRMTEDDQFLSVFYYIEHLFSKIRPQKVFYLAVDGVAPRAKINQQRSRRFRSAKEAAESVKKALDRGEVLPEEEAFDSNCITPGTEFMERLSTQLSYFIAKKVSEDANWRKCRIILSGHEVPGEGEHKIMDFIRQERSKDGYDPNTRHCLYGLDADLIMLGLVSHDPHFCLLREEVSFGPQKRQKNQANPESQRFYLMHLCILREYLDLEFRNDLMPALKDKYDLEKIIDDFILMCLFVGNDFLPHLPDLHINEGALPILYDVYKKVVIKAASSDESAAAKTTGKSFYMNNGGKINYEILYLMLEHLAQKEFDQFEEYQADVDFLISKNSNRKKFSKKITVTEKQKDFVLDMKNFLSDRFAKDLTFTFSSADDALFVEDLVKELGMFYGKGTVDGKPSLTVSHKKFGADSDEGNESTDSDDDDDDEESQLARFRVLRKYEQAAVSNTKLIKSETSASGPNDENENFVNWRKDYYREKLKFKSDSPESVEELVMQYLLGLQWVMFYYYEGVPSWGWFFPYHYAPKISDLITNRGPSELQQIIDSKLPFGIGKPFLPFEQLMGVLPSLSMKHIPEAFRELMVDVNSPILDFYPLNFELDLNGKKNDWEAVVKIPFIDEVRLLEAMKTKSHMLSNDEKRRNSFGNSWIFSYDASLDYQYPSIVTEKMPPLIHCHCKRNVFVQSQISNIKKGLLKNVGLGLDQLPGFPSLKTLKWNSQLIRAQVAIFQQESRNPSIMLRLMNQDELNDVETVDLAKKYLGTAVYAGWPFLAEAVVTGVSDRLNTYQLKDARYPYIMKKAEDPLWKSEQIKVNQNQKPEMFDQRMQRLETQYSKRYGAFINEVEVVFHVCLLKGMKRLDNGALNKNFGDMSDYVQYPYQTVVFSVRKEDPRFIEKPPPTLEEDFPIGTQGFYILDQDKSMYGLACEVVGYAPSKKALNLKITVPKEDPSKQEKIRNVIKNSKDSDKYYSARTVCGMLKLNPLVFSRLTASVFVLFPIAGGDVIERLNLGLGLKFDGRNLKVLGMSRKTAHAGWEYSQAAVDLIKDYATKFPFIIDAMTKKDREAYSLSDLGFTVEQATEELEKVKMWLRLKGIKNLEKIDLSVVMLPKEHSLRLEEVIEESSLQETKIETHNLNGIPAQLILTPDQAQYRLSSESRQNFEIGDKVLFVSNVGSVTFGSAGYVIGVEKPHMNIERGRIKQDQTVVVKDHLWIHVVFDNVFVGGSDLDGKLKKRRGLVLSSDVLLNISNPQPPLRRKFVPQGALEKALKEFKAEAEHAPGSRASSAKGKSYNRKVFKEDNGAAAASSKEKNVWNKNANQRTLLNDLKSDIPLKVLAKAPPKIKKAKQEPKQERLNPNLDWKTMLGVKSDSDGVSEDKDKAKIANDLKKILKIG